MMLFRIMIFTAFALISATISAQMVNNGAVITVNSGSTVSINSSFENANGATLNNHGNMNISGDFTNSASLSGNGIYELNGTSGNQTINTGGQSIYGLKISNGSGNILLANDLTISGDLDLTGSSHFLALGNNTLYLENSAQITGASSSSYIITNGQGAINWNMSTSTPYEFPIGTSTSSYTPALLNNTGTADNFSVRVLDNVYDTYDGTGTPTGTELSPQEEVKKTWIISEGTGGSSTLDVTFQWNSSDEGSSFDRTNSAIAYYNSGWILNNASAAASGSGPYTLARSGLTINLNNTPFGIGSENSPLPISSLNYQASNENGTAILKWTATELVDVKNYIIERATDIHPEFIYLGTVNAVNQKGTENYIYSDKDLSILLQSGAENVYYRLIQVEYNGTKNDAGIKILGSSSASVSSATLLIYPNPFSEQINVAYNVSYTENTNIYITDMNGRILNSVMLNQKTGKQILQIEGMDLATGIYMLHIETANQKQVYKIVKNK